MTAYVVAIRNETHDVEGMKRYAAVAATAPTENITLIASKANRFEVLEGAPAEAIAIMQFPCWDDAMAWYQSEAYTEARRHRQASGDFRLIMIEGTE